MPLRSFGIPTRVRTAAVVLVLGATSAGAQATTGRIAGRVVDAATGTGITDVGVQVVGTTIGVQTGADGRYTIAGAPAGTITLQLRRIGYAAKTVTGLELRAGQTLQQDVALQVATLKLQTQVVSATRERGTVNAALDAQRTATGVVNSVTAEQISRSPDADAAQAVQRVSGVTVQDGKYVFVRGLGERYTTASLNGSRIPSPDPERKVVPLDLFPAGLLQSVTTSKTFTPDQSGDFSGAQVDIRTRDFPARRQFIYTATGGYSSGASGSAVPYAPGAGGEAFASVGAGRDIPWRLRGLDLASPDVTRADKNEVINSFRNVWQAERHTAMPNGSFGVSAGGNDPLFGHRVGYVLSGSYSRSQDLREDSQRALARASSAEAGGTTAYNQFSGPIGVTSALLGGLANFSTLIGSRSHIAFNNTYNRTSDNEARIERGTLEEQNVPVQAQVLDYVERTVRSNQVTGEHDLGRSKIDWAATSSGVTRAEPDRSEIVYEIVPGTAGAAERLLFLASSGEGAVRTFSNLAENSSEGRANYQLELGAPGHEQRLKVGGLFRNTHRDADVHAYGIFANVIPDDERALAPEELFGGRLTTPDSARLDIRELSQGGYYRAQDRLAAGFAMADLGIGERLRLIAGARVERSQVDLHAVSTNRDVIDTTKRFTDALPSAALNVKLTETQSLRLSGSRTLARPEYRELSPIKTRSQLGGFDQIGNPGLIRTLIDNADMRWEMYPRAGEVLSVGVFYKHFHDPIERVQLATSSSAGVITWRNADAANDYGVELEARKGLGFLSEHFEPLTAFANVTLIRSDIQLGEAREALTNANRAMVGQAPYVVNGGLTYTSNGGRASATLLYNRVGQRIVEAGGRPLPDVVERPRDVMDLSLRFPLVGDVAARFDAKNLFDAQYLEKQGGVVRSSYHAGRVFQAGLTWQP